MKIRYEVWQSSYLQLDNQYSLDLCYALSVLVDDLNEFEFSRSLIHCLLSGPQVVTGATAAAEGKMTALVPL